MVSVVSVCPAIAVDIDLVESLSDDTVSDSSLVFSWVISVFLVTVVSANEIFVSFKLL